MLRKGDKFRTEKSLWFGEVEEKMEKKRRRQKGEMAGGQWKGKTLRRLSCLFTWILRAILQRAGGLQLVQPIMAARRSLGCLKHRLERSL